MSSTPTPPAPAPDDDPTKGFRKGHARAIGGMHHPHSTRRRSAALGVVGALAIGAALVSSAPTPWASAVTSTGERTSYFPISPCRLMNTRPGDNQVGPRTSPLPGGSPVRVDARGAEGNCSADDLPADAVALQLNVTPVNASAPTDITIWPDGPIPQASSLNPRPGPPVPNAVTATLAGDGSFLMQNKNGTIDMVIDVVGFYTDHDHTDLHYTKAETDDLIDTHRHDDRYYTEAESDQFRTNISGRVSALEAGGSSEGRTTFVGGDGTSGAIGNDLADAVTAAAGESPTADEPWIIRLDAGTFATNELTLPAHVHLRGSGPGVSIILGRINATGDTSVSALTIDNPGVSSFRSITTSSELSLDRVEVLGDSGLAVGSGAEVQVSNSDFVIGNGPVVVPVSAPASATVEIRGSNLRNSWAGGTALSVDGGKLVLDDVSGSFGANGVEADTVDIDRSHLVASGQFQVTNAGAMTVTNSYLERSPSTTFRVISVVGVGAVLTVVDSAVMGGGGGGDDAVGATESCTAVAHDLGFEDTGCP